MAMSFNEYVIAEGLSYHAAAKRFGLPNGTTARRYALGLARPRERRMQEIYIRSGGKVAPSDWYPGIGTPQIAKANSVQRHNGVDRAKARLSSRSPKVSN